jgi:hypothetical protein
MRARGAEDAAAMRAGTTVMHAMLCVARGTRVTSSPR